MKRLGHRLLTSDVCFVQEDVTEAEAAALVDKYQKLGNQATLSLATSESVAEDMTAETATSLNVCHIKPQCLACYVENISQLWSLSNEQRRPINDLARCAGECRIPHPSHGGHATDAPTPISHNGHFIWAA
jgi:hypothetical protein